MNLIILARMVGVRKRPPSPVRSEADLAGNLLNLYIMYNEVNRLIGNLEEVAEMELKSHAKSIERWQSFLNGLRKIKKKQPGKNTDKGHKD